MENNEPKLQHRSLSINDALDVQNDAFMIPRAMTTIVQEGIEPLLIGEKLLQKIQYKPGMTTVFPAIEPLRADEAGDGMDLPQYNINIGGARSLGVTVKRPTSYTWSRHPFPAYATFTIRYRR
jgi:hypothetical protein